MNLESKISTARGSVEREYPECVSQAMLDFVVADVTLQHREESFNQLREDVASLLKAVRGWATRVLQRERSPGSILAARDFWVLP